MPPELPTLTGNAYEDCKKLLGHIALLQRFMVDWWDTLNQPGSINLQANAIDSCPIGTDGREAIQCTTLDASGNITADESTVNALEHLCQYLSLVDAISAPAAATGKARLYVDIADGDLKVKFADGVTKTIATDT